MEEGFALINMSKYKRWTAFLYRMIEKKNYKKENRLIRVFTRSEKVRKGGEP